MRNSIPSVRPQSSRVIFPFLMFLFAASLPHLIGCKSGDPVLEVRTAEALLSPIIIGSASVFMEIANSGPGADSLISARLDIPSAVVELHDMQDGKMVKTDAILVRPRETARLRPFGQHIMVFRLPKDIKAGDRFTMVLTFKKSGVISVPVTVVPAYGAAAGRR